MKSFFPLFLFATLTPSAGAQESLTERLWRELNSAGPQFEAAKEKLKVKPKVNEDLGLSFLDEAEKEAEKMLSAKEGNLSFDQINTIDEVSLKDSAIQRETAPKTNHLRKRSFYPQAEEELIEKKENRPIRKRSRW